MCCLSLIEATEKLKQQSGNFPWGGAFKQLFGPVRGESEHKFSKNSNARGVARGGGGGCWSFDLTGTLYDNVLNKYT